MVELDADIARAAIENEIDFVAEILQHVLGADRADMARAVRRRRGDRALHFGEQRVRGRMRRHAQADAAEPGTSEIADAACLRDRHDQGQRPRPEARGEFSRLRGEGSFAHRRFRIGDMRDQRIERGPSLRRIKPRDGSSIRRVRPKPVDGLGRERDETAVADEPRRLGNARRVRGADARVPRHRAAAKIYFDT